MSNSNSLRGWSFFLRLAGGALLAGIIFFVIGAIFFRLLFAWGILGFFLFLVVIGLLAGWWSDRKAKAQREAELSD